MKIIYRAYFTEEKLKLGLDIDNFKKQVPTIHFMRFVV